MAWVRRLAALLGAWCWLPDNSFFLRTVPLIQDTLDRLSRNNFSVTLSIIDSTAVNLHTIEDQLLTAVIQLCPKLTASRVCFGTPSRHPERPQPASQPVQNPPIYSPRASEVTHSPRRRRSGGAQPRSQAAKKPAKRRKFGGNHRQQTAKHHHHRCLDNVQEVILGRGE
ncbi:hypothetical protein B0H65DRAFT_544483 [Neurospora tetraspora]|uniref:Uncharacterized protein n=1 Tax=Neurospora tetraspora TaxID=94610 RepID=A0AAE0JPR2_9PEZI|nr:hypothetical protein B0H65DRAFT_544483 [Neurospora tetraspora]